MDEPAQPVFDEYGYLTPPGPHKGSLCHIRLHFVEGIIPSESRPWLFRDMIGIIRKFKYFLHTDCIQVWVGGIFISNQPEPECTKICLVIDHEAFNDADEHTREALTKLMRPYEDTTHMAELIRQNMNCDIHLLLEDPDSSSPSYLSDLYFKKMMENLFRLGGDKHPKGYFICNVEGTIEDDTEQTETAQ